MVGELSSPDAVGFDLCIVPKPHKGGGSLSCSTMYGSIKEICSMRSDARKQ